MFARDADRLLRLRTTLVEIGEGAFRVDVERVGEVGAILLARDGWAALRDGSIVVRGVPRRRSAVRRLLMDYDRDEIDPGAGSTADRERAARARYATTGKGPR